LKFEAPVHPTTPAPSSAPLPSAENLFPHLYGPLNFDAVERQVELPPGPNGIFELPALD
jgi:uncharacterized protein (DUF952 family)